MRANRVRRVFLGGFGILLATGTTGCAGDNNPYGPPYRDIFHTIVGAYRPFELLERALPFLPGEFQPSPDGSEIRFVFLSGQGITGRIFVPGAGPGGGDLDVRLLGDWRYDVPAQQVVLTFDPSVGISPPQIVFQITFLADRIRLEGETVIGSFSLPLDLGKPLPPEDAPGSGCFNCVAFDVIPVP